MGKESKSKCITAENLEKERVSTFSKNLRYLRVLSGLTQGNMAEELEIKRCTYAAYEEGRSEPSIGLYLKICEFFGIGAFDLYGGRWISESKVKDVKI